MKATAKTLKLVQTTQKKSSAPRLRAGIIKGTLGKDAGPYPKVSAEVQRAIDRKARILADAAFDVIRESLVRQVGNRCFTGRHYENFHAEVALEIVGGATLDSALAPLMRHELEWAAQTADFLLDRARKCRDEIAGELRRFNRTSDGGSAA